ncbi:glycosyltransferase family A protein [Cellvibrio sp. KY-GH-1]|uniref:glycosyltransferase family 2 protein n=1 Tax=Cellvibrio sp. KY-GH-1 TaxID=2303332 RepID=UPI00178344F5|nr:glycosyltransferase family A protein [Cellvibrio sp. KY-GH-1]
MKKVSIVMPAYNCERFIGKTIESILQQTYSNFELLIIDDGSTDGTKAVIDSYNDDRIRYFFQKNHGGPSKARNKGIDSALGDFIFIFDSDDLMRPEKLEKSVAALESNPEANILCTRFSLIDESNEILRDDYLREYTTLSALIGTEEVDGRAYYLSSRELLPTIIKTNFIGTSSVALRKTALTAGDRFDENLKNADDRLMWIQLSSQHNGIFLNSILHDYRVVKSGITGQGMLKKGPNKIAALEKAKAFCKEKDLISLLDKEISNNYLSMSRESKNKKDTKMQRIYAKQSIKYNPNYKALKLLVSSYAKGII